MKQNSLYPMRSESRVSLRLRSILLAASLLTCLNALAQQKHGDGLDDVLQYVPYAALLGLKAVGLESRDDWAGVVVATAGSWVATAGVAYTLKHTVREWRPDGSDRKSFPSGHSAFAFAGATMLHKQYAHLSPWISVAGYGVATVTAVDRVVRERHHWYDVAAGAGIGLLSAEAAYYVSSRLFSHQQVAIGFTGNQLDVAIRW